METGTCLKFADTLTVLTEGRVVEGLGQLKLVVDGTPEDQETVESALAILRALTSAADLLKEPQLSPDEIKRVLNDIVGILNSLLGWDPHLLRTYGSKFVENFEDILVKLISSQNFTDQLSIAEDDVALLATPVVAETHGDNPLPFTISSVEGTPNIVDGDGVKNAASLKFPTSVFITEQVTEGSTGQLAVAVLVYEVPVFFPTGSNSGAGLQTTVGTPVVSMMVARGGQQLEFDGLEPPVEVTLAVTQEDRENATNQRCAFWDFNRDEWSTDGCKTQFSASEGHITCTCTHLTNFAGLVDVCRRVEGCETDPEAEYALSIVSIVGACLSLVGLAMTVFTMLYFKKLRKRDASKFHIQLCLAMFAMLLVFVVGVQQTEVKAGCVTVSVLIHYFTLVAVMWMGAEALLMFQKLVIVFGRVTTRHIVIISLICWLTPILPVIIPVAINPDYVIFEPQDNSAGFCFISNTTAFFAAFLAPILVIILFNFAVFIIIVFVLIRHKHRSKLTGFKASKSKERHSTIRLMISIAGIMSLHGLTWLFGALTIDKASFAFQVIFVVLNSLQGFFIFLFFCVLGRDGRELWLEFLFCGRYKSNYLHPTSATISSADSKKTNKMLLVSDNTSSTAAPVVEKSFTVEASGETYVVNYMEFSERGKDSEVVGTSDSSETLTPEPALTFREEIEDTQKRNGTSHISLHTTGNRHLVENDRASHTEIATGDRENKVEDSDDEDTEEETDFNEENSTGKEYPHHTMPKLDNAAHIKTQSTD